MSTDDIISYKRQKTVNRVFIVICIAIILATLWFRPLFVGWEFYVFSLVIVPLGIFSISLLFGALSKRGIDYIPGEWKKEKIWVSFNEYERLADSHKEAYGHLFGADEPCGCCCTAIILPMFGILIIGFLEFSPPLFSTEIDSLLFFLLDFIIAASLGFLWGFKYPKIDSEVFFKIPMDDDVFTFVEALDGVVGLNVGVAVEIGTRGNSRVLLNAEPKIKLEGLPDTVSVKVQVSHSGFAYPYLVGTVYKGPTLSEETEEFSIRTKYPAIIETSMDGEVSVYVARFKIPKRTSSVPSIAKGAFRKLASLLIDTLQKAV